MSDDTADMGDGGPGDGATPWADQHVDDSHTEAPPRRDVPAPSQDDASDSHKISDSGEFDFDLGELPDQAATDAVFAELTAMAPVSAKALRDEWGPDAPANLSFARATVKTFGDKEFIDFFDDLELDGSPLGHGARIKAMKHNEAKLAAELAAKAE